MAGPDGLPKGIKCVRQLERQPGKAKSKVFRLAAVQRPAGLPFPAAGDLRAMQQVNAQVREGGRELQGGVSHTAASCNNRNTCTLGTTGQSLVASRKAAGPGAPPPPPPPAPPLHDVRSMCVFICTACTRRPPAPCTVQMEAYEATRDASVCPLLSPLLVSQLGAFLDAGGSVQRQRPGRPKGSRNLPKKQPAAC